MISSKKIIKLTSFFLLFIFPLLKTWGTETVDISLLSPVVVQTTPMAGDMEVDPGFNQIKIKFSHSLLQRGYSLVKISDASFPLLQGEPIFEDNGKTVIFSVKLNPNTHYALWINSDNFKNFKGINNQTVIPYLLMFKTK